VGNGPNGAEHMRPHLRLGLRLLGSFSLRYFLPGFLRCLVPSSTSV
jgi:hypothetical protein